MATGSYRQADVMCPYYAKDDGGRLLNCEGPVKGTANRMQFRNGRAMQRHMEKCCCSTWKKCPIAEANERKYEEET